MKKQYNSFTVRVRAIVSSIKPGTVMTYKEVAKRAGNTKASRAVGTIMANNKDKHIPCHRVVKADGSIGAYNGLRGKSKMNILKKEGVRFTDGDRVVL
jgi:methylated-DNA-[protein]-cysteine S-methyltransferase